MDAIVARDSHVFVASTFSNLGKEQLTKRGVQWVELQTKNGYRKFAAVLQALGVSFTDFDGDFDARLPQTFGEIFAPA
jgi:hypothetical protein